MLRSTIQSVRAGRRDLENFPSPPWEFLLICPNRLSSFNSDRSSVLPGICSTCQPRLQTSHRPDGRLTFCLLFAGRRCQRPGWHSVNRELPDLLQHRFRCARRSCSKVPIAPMGKLLTCLPRLTLAQLRTLRSTSGGACHRDLESSHRPHGRLTFCTLFAGRRCLCQRWISDH